MTPEERQLLSGLFDRMRGMASGERDAEAEALINREVRAQPYAPYLLTQTVLIQEQALEAASQRILELEDQVRAREPAKSQPSSFLGGMRQVFGGSQPQQPSTGPSSSSRSSVPPAGGRYPPEPGSQPWGQSGPGAPPPPQPQQAAGGGFLRNALATATGVAGGAMLFEGIKGLMGGGSGAAQAGHKPDPAQAQQTAAAKPEPAQAQQAEDTDDDDDDDVSYDDLDERASGWEGIET